MGWVSPRGTQSLSSLNCWFTIAGDATLWREIGVHHDVVPFLGVSAGELDQEAVAGAEGASRYGSFGQSSSADWAAGAR